MVSLTFGWLLVLAGGVMVGWLSGAVYCAPVFEDGGVEDGCVFEGRFVAGVEAGAFPDKISLILFLSC